MRTSLGGANVSGLMIDQNVKKQLRQRPLAIDRNVKPPETFAMIGGEYEHGLLRQSPGCQELPEASQLLVDVAHLRVLAATVGLMQIVQVDKDEKRLIGIAF